LRNRAFFDFDNFDNFVKLLKACPEIDRLYNKLKAKTNGGVFDFGVFEISCVKNNRCDEFFSFLFSLLLTIPDFFLRGRCAKSILGSDDLLTFHKIFYGRQ
jgi:hypothetical protein